MMLANLGAYYAAGATEWTPAALFAQGQQGVWYEPEPEYLFQNSSGTTPVTANNDPVGLMLDRVRPLDLGPELVTNGTFDTDAAGWGSTLVTATVTDGQVSVDSSSGGGRLEQQLAVAAGWKEATFEIVSVLNSSTSVRFGTTSGGNDLGSFALGAGLHTVRFLCPGTSLHVGLFPAGVGTAVFDNISVRDLPGWHAAQTTSADRMRYSTTPPNLVPDEVADQLDVTLPGIAAATVAIATPVGADIQYPVDLSAGSYVIDYENAGVIIREGELTVTETQRVTDYLNARAGV